MKHLIIIGAGGMGKELFSIATECKGYLTEFDIKGFLDHPNTEWDESKYAPILGLEDDYEIQADDVFTCSIGDITKKKRAISKVLSKGGCFINLIHTTALVRNGAKIGVGCILDKGVVIGSDSVVGDYCLIQGNTAVGHEASVGNFCRFDYNVLLVGGVVVEDDVCVHTGAVISHNVIVGRGSTVAALSFVIKPVEEGSTVYGNPAKKLPTIL